MSQIAAKAVQIFFSYAHKDEELRDRLATHLSILKRQAVIQEWHDRNIDAGEEWRAEIDRHLEEADVILLLISADFLASDYCYEVEMKRAMERHAAKAARVIPIILRPVVWQSAPFGKLQALPKNGKPITSWKNRDAAFTDVVDGVRRAIAGPAVDQPSPPRRVRLLLIAAVTFLLLLASFMAYYLFLRPELKVKSDRQTKVYIDDRLIGETTDDGILSQRVDSGQHSIRLVKDKYDAYTEVRQFGLWKTVRIRYYFAESGSEGVDFRIFEQEKANSQWVIPQTTLYRIDQIDTRLYLTITNAPGLLFRERCNYGNFRMKLSLILTNARGAAWAVRVKDENNYYLFYLAGPDNGLKLVPGFYFYIVRDNKFALVSHNSPNIANDLIAGGHYLVWATVVGNKIDTCIREVAEGNDGSPHVGHMRSLGTFVDKDNWFTKGSIGFRTIGSEEFSIGSFSMDPAGQQPLDPDTCDFQSKGQDLSPPK